jgi:DNA polymerase elongation subunit (family B)
MEKKLISQEIIESFLNGADSEEFIVNIEYDYRRNIIYKIIQDPVKGKIVKQDTIIPFLWVGDLTELNFYQKNKTLQKDKILEHGIIIEPLKTYGNQRLERGLKYLVKSVKGYTNLLNFFKQGGIDPWSDKYKEYFQILSITEQYLIQKKKRLFKGIEDYSDIHRFMFDIETSGLNPEVDKIILIGVKDNRGLRKLIDAIGKDGEKGCIQEFFNIIKETKPTIIGGHNSASFDWPFILKRAEILKMNIYEITQIIYPEPIKVKERILKLANEIEPYNQYVIWGFNIIDTSHSVRRAQAINSDIKSWGLKYIVKYLEKEKPNRIYIDGSKISKIYIENESYYVNPKSGGWRKIGDPGTENLLERFPGKYEIWSGRKLVEQYLDDDLYETMIVDDSFCQSTFLLSKLVPTAYERITTMGTATLWKLIMLAWSYEYNLAIPEKDERRPITGGLSRLLKVGYSKNIVKFDYTSLYPSIQLAHNVFPDCDVMGAQKAMLKYFRNLRINYKRLKEENEKINPELSEYYDRKQLPLKIFINAYFGSCSAPKVFHWGDMNIGETITCTGRQYLRMTIMWFMKKGYEPITMDTDGICFAIPNDVNEHQYIGKGSNELVIKDKKYNGVEADCAEFNDIFLRNEMGLDIDYIAQSMVNISRKNYILKITKKGKEKIKLTGNTIKSKKLPQYIVEFMNDGFNFLLNGDGQSFINLYYSYIEKLYNHKIPLVKIANKARVKQTIEDYKKYIKKVTKSGSLMPRQTHMELIWRDQYPATLGETIYYVNNGNKKSCGDVEKNRKTGEIDINCYMINEFDILNNPDMTGEYNVEKYIGNFNKRIEPLLVVFNPEIRNDILVTNPENRQYLTSLQCELDRGHPLKSDGQDKLDEILTLSDMEVLFWNRINIDPYYMYVEDTLSLVDQDWVNHNRKVMKKEDKGIINNKEDEIIDNDGRDLAYITILKFK